MRQDNHSEDDPKVTNDTGIVEVMAKRVGSLVAFLLKHSTFEFGFCAAGCAPILHLVHPPLGLVALAMGVGATAGKIGKLLDKRLRRVYVGVHQGDTRARTPGRSRSRTIR